MKVAFSWCKIGDFLNGQGFFGALGALGALGEKDGRLLFLRRFFTTSFWGFLLRLGRIWVVL